MSLGFLTVYCSPLMLHRSSIINTYYCVNGFTALRLANLTFSSPGVEAIPRFPVAPGTNHIALMVSFRVFEGPGSINNRWQRAFKPMRLAGQTCSGGTTVSIHT